jgi:L-ribulose-5-phosphate 3-epimerase
MFRIGYNTNGFNCHSLAAALGIIADLGYKGVAITLDHYALNPWDPHLKAELKRTRKLLEGLDLACVIETGARFLLDPRQKHEPTLITPSQAGRKRRVEFLRRALQISSELHAEALSIWSGIKQTSVTDDDAWLWLTEGCGAVAVEAEARGIPVAFEPEPGMFIETLDQYEKLKAAVDHPMFALTLDLGHAFITEPIAPEACIRKFAADIRNIHIEDMKKEAHSHLFFGDGELNFAPIFDALKEIDYRGPVNVELSRHSHNAVRTAKMAMAYLNQLI